jgi:VanZ family protein
VTPAARTRWIGIVGATLIAVIVVASLIPANMQLRTGLGWLTEHFLAYFAVTAIFCLAWPRPLIVGPALMVLSGAIEALQGLTPDRVPDLPTALSGAGGALLAALLASLVIQAARRLGPKERA